MASSRQSRSQCGSDRKARTLTVNTAWSFAQTLRFMATSRVMVESNDFATKREAYYISKNWGECRFDEQAESDAIMDDIEAMASMHGLSREQLRKQPPAPARARPKPLRALTDAEQVRSGSSSKSTAISPSSKRNSPRSTPTSTPACAPRRFGARPKSFSPPCQALAQ
jgi:hypothetical protein